MAQNLEIKARYDDLSRAAQIAEQAHGTFAGVLHQVDTYFHAPSGRLKVRQNRAVLPNGEETNGGELIAYQRPNECGTRMSTYTVTPIADPIDCIAGLSAVLGVRVVVRKRRELWLLGATRIHLDDVDDLGRFIELETVITTQGELDAREEHERLIRLLEIPQGAAMAGSYSELLLDRTLRLPPE
jgi:predicted adenylyl cyclase CyaB